MRGKFDYIVYRLEELRKKVACCTSCFDTNYEIPPQSRKFEPGYRSGKRRRAFYFKGHS